MSASSSRAVSISTGTGRSAWMRRHTSWPSMPGSITSRTTTSGSPAWASCDRGEAVEGLGDVVPLGAQPLGQLVVDDPVVLDHQHPSSCHGSTLGVPRRGRRGRLVKVVCRWPGARPAIRGGAAGAGVLALSGADHQPAARLRARLDPLHPGAGPEPALHDRSRAERRSSRGAALGGRQRTRAARAGAAGRPRPGRRGRRQRHGVHRPQARRCRAGSCGSGSRRSATARTRGWR